MKSSYPVCGQRDDNQHDSTTCQVMQSAESGDEQDYSLISKHDIKTQVLPSSVCAIYDLN